MRALLVVTALLLSACTTAEEEPDAPAPATTSAATTSGTEPGTQLAHGEAATLVWQPARDVTGELELSVEAIAEKWPGVLKRWVGGEAAGDARPYFVTVTLANVGESDLGGQDVPLYLRDTRGTLGAPWTLGGDFAPCQSGPLPTPFEPGEEAEMCLLYLVPDRGRVQDVVFEPTEGYDPITWTGEVRELRTRGERARSGGDTG